MVGSGAGVCEYDPVTGARGAAWTGPHPVGSAMAKPGGPTTGAAGVQLSAPAGGEVAGEVTSDPAKDTPNRLVRNANAIAPTRLENIGRPLSRPRISPRPANDLCVWQL